MDIDREYWNSVKRPEVINKEYANSKYSYLKENMIHNWRIIPNHTQDTIPLYSNYTHDNHILPNKKVHNFKWMTETPLWNKKPNFNLKPFEKYNNELKFETNNYLDTKINKIGDDESVKERYDKFVKNTEKKNRLLIESVIEDTEILTKPEDNYKQHYNTYGYELYK